MRVYVVGDVYLPCIMSCIRLMAAARERVEFIFDQPPDIQSTTDACVVDGNVGFPVEAVLDPDAAGCFGTVVSGINLTDKVEVQTRIGFMRLDGPRHESTHAFPSVIQHTCEGDLQCRNLLRLR